MLYICLSGIALLNVIVAMIVESTLKTTMNENEKDRKKEMEEDQRLACERLMKVFWAADESGDGSITRPEWTAALRKEDVLTCLAHFDLNRDQGEAIFDAIDLDGSGELGIVEFVQGIMSGNRTSRAYDVISVQCDVLRLKQLIESSFDELKARISSTEVPKPTSESVKFGGLNARITPTEGETAIQRLGENPNSNSVESRLTGVENNLSMLTESMTKRFDRLERCMEQLLNKDTRANEPCSMIGSEDGKSTTVPSAPSPCPPSILASPPPPSILAPPACEAPSAMNVNHDEFAANGKQQQMNGYQMKVSPMENGASLS